MNDAQVEVLLNKIPRKADIGIKTNISFTIPASFIVVMKTRKTSALIPHALVLRGGLENKYYFHSPATGTYGPFDTDKEALELLGPWLEWDILTTVEVHLE